MVELGKTHGDWRIALGLIPVSILYFISVFVPVIMYSIQYHVSVLH